ncbi:putative glutamate synthase [Daphnia sinensis]|uniref:glutamate synthase (ferredoxin) n=1 Tax=Daphnia sinensis TaxID=1820382 RepID=A0AAD5KU90_9CRUS|nr:putative glutamate synthase [Daphnia sinensis]
MIDQLKGEQQGKGLYVPELEKDSCGTGFIANLNGIQTHQLVEDALTMLTNMEHRGAVGSEPNTGDGAGYRMVPTDDESLGETAVSVEPRMEHVFVKPRQVPSDRYWLERRLYVLRKYATHKIHTTIPNTTDHFYMPSFSYKTVIYKGQLTTHQVRPYYPDLHDKDLKSAIALIHSRFSTNTVPKWKLAQPFRYIAHNGEINTITGNINWWKSKEMVMESSVFTQDELEKLFPVCGQALSDSANFDNVLEFLVMNGRSLPHALMMMIPEAWQHDNQMADYKKAFYEYHETMMEPWDGPAAICFTDGIVVGATLDRNGLRPLRYCLTDDNILIAASEAGALEVPQEKVVLKGRLQPGKMLIADLDQHRIIDDEEVKNIICKNKDYETWVQNNKKTFKNLKYTEGVISDDEQLAVDQKFLTEKQQLFGFTKEDIKILISPMVKSGEEAIGSMGADTPLAVLSQRPQHLSSYFKQLFAQVTNPPIDPIRERSVMSLHVKLAEGGDNILSPSEDWARFIALEQPILKNSELSILKHINYKRFKSEKTKKGNLAAAIDRICANAESAVRHGANILILSDRETDILNAPIPSLMAVGAVHHHLIKAAINPYMAFATAKSIVEHEGGDAHYAIDKYIKAVGKGLLKVMSKIGISTLQSYAGAQIFEILGLNSEVVNKCFTKSVSRIEGVGFDGVAEEVLAKHRLAYIDTPLGLSRQLEEGGIYQWKRRGEAHTLNPQSIHYLQLATRTNDYQVFKKYTEVINKQDEQALTLRGLLTFRKGKPIPIEEVEPVEKIFKRFATGAMSFGSISHEAHSTLAIAMNRLGGRSNSGEGGEDEIRYEIKENGDSERSAIKQVASGRFGVTSYYLSQADELQIKMAQGAKPGEGGQLPGHKVDDWIGKVRHSTPGVGLISPPPHHDIYSIEDLAQLIYDLKNSNPKADINVKLVSKAGVGIIASGVAKAKADKILIAGYDGGTGASPLSSVRHAGLPWELGLAETHQVLVKNKCVIEYCSELMDNCVQVQRSGVLLRQALIVEGCIMMRKCHVNTCPVGIATQDLNYAVVSQIKNTDRSVGTMLSYEISKKYKGAGLPEDTLNYRFNGSAGQSFGAFLTKGVTFTLRGESNDYFGKGLSGGKLAVSPDEKATFNLPKISLSVMWHYMERLLEKPILWVWQASVLRYVTQVLKPL